uniref:carnosine N-methyltransferase n=1 Tax=Romanomermis culicivorax TaxID=13658 RepID=A0A915HT62_ROMCU
MADGNNPNNYYQRVPNSKSHSSSDLASCSKLIQENHRRRKTTDDNELEDEEAEHFERINATFVHYKARCLRQLQKQLFFYNRLTPRHKSMLQNDNGVDSYVEHLKRVKSCIDENQKFLNLITARVGRMFENQNYDDHDIRDPTTKRKKWTDERSVSEFNMEKLRSTLKQFVRDWAEEGKEERESCYTPVLEDLKQLFPDPKGVEVLVPGAGLGRLAWDIAKAGYNCEGNEFSLFMLFGSNYILNHCKAINSVTIYPFVHQWTNNLSYEDQVRPVSIPDVETSSPMPDGVKFCMSAGDFTEIYAKKRSYPMQQANGCKNDKNNATDSCAKESLCMSF